MKRKLESLLDQLVDKLNTEKKLLVQSIKDTKYSKELEQVVEEKRRILSQIAQFSKEDFNGLEDKLLEIKRLSDINLNLAVNNIQFIDEIFSTIFDQPQKYNQKGSVEKPQKGLFNKKI